MRGVKGLVLKEIYLRRKTFLYALSVFVLFYILAVSFCLSFDFGNLKYRTDVSPDMVVPLSYAVAAAGMIIFCLGSETTVKDARCGWDIFRRTLPVSPARLAAVRTGLAVCSWLAGFVISTLLTMVIFALAHRQFTRTEFANISLIALAVFAISMVLEIIMLRAGDPGKAAQIYAALFIFIIGAAGAFISLKLDELSSLFSGDPEAAESYFTENYIAPLTELRDRLFPLFPLIFAAMAAAAYFLILAQMKRREK